MQIQQKNYERKKPGFSSPKKPGFPIIAFLPGLFAVLRKKQILLTRM
jgi:hypothetical protein